MGGRRRLCLAAMCGVRGSGEGAALSRVCRKPLSQTRLLSLQRSRTEKKFSPFSLAPLLPISLSNISVFVSVLYLVSLFFVETFHSFFLPTKKRRKLILDSERKHHNGIASHSPGQKKRGKRTHARALRIFRRRA